MIISIDRLFLYIHIYKVAGTSISEVLEPYRDSLYKEKSLQSHFHRLLRKLNLPTNYPFYKYYPFQWHTTASYAKEHIAHKIFDNLFKFTFVRNPWDWQVSLYHFALQDPQHHQHKLISSMSGFEEYLEWRINEDLHLQKEFVAGENDEILLDFIGRYEYLQQDFDEVCDRIGIERLKLPHINKSNHGDYQEYYNQRTRKIVRDAFSEDIELFGYEFSRSPVNPLRFS